MTINLASPHLPGGSAFHKPAQDRTGVVRPGPLLPEGEEHNDPPAPGDTVTIVEPPAPKPTPPVTKTFTEQEVERIRQEEKDKLYGRLSEWEKQFNEQREQLAALQAAKDAEVAAAAEAARAAAEEEARKKWEEQDSKTLLAEVNQQWEQRFQTLQQERELERAAFAKEQEFAALKEYANEKVNAAKANNEIAPELVDFVSGNTQEEIDASLEFVKAKSAEIAENIRNAAIAQRAAMPGVSTAGYSTSGPMDSTPGTKTFTADELKNMSMADYQRYRDQLLPAARSAQQGRGLYG